MARGRAASSTASPDIRDDLLALAGAAGAAVVSDDRCCAARRDARASRGAGARRLAVAAASGRRSSPPTRWPTSTRRPAAFTDRASGLLAVSISQLHASYVLWFRPEVVRTVQWAGDPRKPVGRAGGRAALHPRTSFEIWKETVRGRSLPWRPAEIEAAKRTAQRHLGIVLRRAEELAALSEELERSNKELEAFSYSVSHDLRAPFRHIVGYAELLREREGDRLATKAAHYLDTIIESALSAGTLVDDLLASRRWAAPRCDPVRVDMNELVRGGAPDVARRRRQGRSVDWRDRRAAAARMATRACCGSCSRTCSSTR